MSFQASMTFVFCGIQKKNYSEESLTLLSIQCKSIESKTKLDLIDKYCMVQKQKAKTEQSKAKQKKKKKLMLVKK